MERTSAPRVRWPVPRQLFGGMGLLLLYAVVSAVVLHSFMSRWGFREDETRFGLEAMLEGTAHRPFVYRVLAPALINGVAALVPASFLESHRGFFQEHSAVLHYWRNPAAPGLAESLHYHLAYALVFISLLALLVTTRRLTRVGARVPDLLADVAPAVALLILPLTFAWGGYVYDFPELLLLALALLLLLEGRLLGFYSLLPVAVVNKETALLLPLYFLAVFQGRLPRSRLLAHLGAQFALAGALVLVVRAAFAGNPGGDVEWHLRDNLGFWLSAEAFTRTADPFGGAVPLPQGAHVVILALAAFFILHGWGHEPPAIRAALGLPAAVLLPLFLVAGHRDELRSLALLAPPAYLLGVSGVSRLYGSGGETSLQPPT